MGKKELREKRRYRECLRIKKAKNILLFGFLKIYEKKKIYLSDFSLGT